MTAPRGQPLPRAGQPAAAPPVDARQLLDDDAAATAWGRACGLLQPEDAGRLLRGIAEQGITFDLLDDLCTRLTPLLPAVSPNLGTTVCTCFVSLGPRRLRRAQQQQRVESSPS